MVREKSCFIYKLLIWSPTVLLWGLCFVIWVDFFCNRKYKIGRGTKLLL